MSALPPNVLVASYRRLAWAGLELRWDAQRLLIDPLEDTAPLAEFLGAPRGTVRRSEPGGAARTDVLLTHAHPDHFDPVAIRRAVQGGGAVWCMPEIAPTVAAALRDDVAVREVPLWEEVGIGAMRARPVPAQDWRSDPQVSWSVGTAGGRLLHCGDTIWHGHWWRIAEALGPLAVACLPINGFTGHWPGTRSADVPGTLTPHQAVEAAHVLGARVLCPIHFGLFDNPPVYTEWPDALDTLRTLAARRGIEVRETGSLPGPSES